MPRVPTHDPSVGVAGTPTPFGSAPTSTIERAGAQAARGLRIVGEAANRIAQQAKDEQESILLTERWNKLSDGLNDLRHHPESGIASLKAGQAIGSANKYEQQGGQLYDELRADLSPDLQRIFDQKALPMMRQYSSGIMRYEGAQRDVHRDNTYKAMIPRITRDVLQSTTDDDFKHNLSEGRLELIKMLRGPYGMTKDNATAQADAWASTAISASIADLMRDNVASAETRMKQYAHLLMPDDEARLRSMLEPRTDRARQLLLSNEIWDDNVERTDQGAVRSSSVDAMIAQARDAIDDADDQDAVIQRLEQRAAMESRGFHNRREEASRQALEIILRTGSADNIPDELQLLIGHSNMSSLIDYANKLSADKTPETDLRVWHGLRQMDPETFMNDVNMLDYIDSLSPSAFQWFSDLQADYRNASKKPGVTKTTASADQFFKRALANFETRHERDLEDDIEYELFLVFSEAVQERQRLKGAPLENSDYMEILGQAFEAVKVDRTWPRQDIIVPAAALGMLTSEQQQEAVLVREFPEEVVSAARDFLGSLGKAKDSRGQLTKPTETETIRWLTRLKTGRVPEHEAQEYRNFRTERKEAEEQAMQALAMERQAEIDNAPVVGAEREITLYYMKDAGLDTFSEDDIRKNRDKIRARLGLDRSFDNLDFVPEVREYRKLRGLGMSDREAKIEMGIPVAPPVESRRVRLGGDVLEVGELPPAALTPEEGAREIAERARQTTPGSE